MRDLTADGSGSGTKRTKRTKITSTKWLFVIIVAVVILVPAFAVEPLRRGLAVARAEPVAGGGGMERAAWPVLLAAQQQPQTEAQQRPVFRGGTHFVRVDAYPSENGHIVAGLKPEDFEVFEDGKRQAVESFDFISFEG